MAALQVWKKECIINGDFDVMSFRHVVWLAPLAFALHVGDEWPRFVPWAHRFASAQFTPRDYLLTHVSGFVSFLGMAVVLSRWSYSPLVFVYFAFLLLPAMLWNIGFHLGATAFSRTYCPGVVTAVLVYPPVLYLMTQSAWREGLLSSQAWVATLLITGVFHTWEVGHNVCKAW